MVRAKQPLHKSSAAFCAFLANQPKVWPPDLAKWRQDCDNLTASYPEPAGVAVTKVTAGAIPCLLHTPPGWSKGSPVVVYFHGGGHTIGSAAGYGNFCCALAAASGLPVLNVEYRLAPESRFPTAVEDCWAVVRWLADVGGEAHGLDKNKIALSGDSAGGNLAIVTAMMARDAGVPVKYVLSLCPLCDGRASACEEVKEEEATMVSFGEGLLLERRDIRYFTESYMGSLQNKERASWKFSPVLGELKGLPRMTIVAAGYDTLRDQEEDFAKKAREAGSPVSFECWEAEYHVWFLHAKYVPHAKEALPHFARMLKEGLGLPASRL